MSKDKRPDLEDELDFDFEETEVDSSPSPVARSARKNFILLLIIVVAAIVAIYYIVFGGKKPPKDNQVSEVSNKVTTVKPTTLEDNIATSIPVLPPPPPLEIPKAPEPVAIQAPQPALPEPTPAVVLPTAPIVSAPIISSNDDTNFKATMEARKRSSIMLTAGGAGQTTSTENKAYIESDAYFIPDKTSAAQQKATMVGKTSAVIAQGKIIDAVVETALNTDLAGTIRAMVTRDVYAESGRNILIPKGSRLIGTYPSTIKTGQDRIAIVWTRLIRPDGIDLMIDSPGVDKLGRPGVQGILDNKYLESIGNAVLLSSLNIGFAIGADKLTNAQNTTKTDIVTGTGTTVTQTTGKSSDTATQQAVTDLQNAGKQVVQNSLQVSPTITIDQGTIMKVFVNRDLIFPAHMVAGSIRMVE
ncbi:MAG: TrbI/VirB10 family protein [Alphaproteobacteria bacterium]